jgi:small multidrug resistance pump
LAIVLEVGGTLSMKAAAGFTRLVPSLCVFVFYSLCLGALTLAIDRIDVSTVYAVWAGLGTAIVAAIGIFYFKEPAGALKLLSIALIIAGVVGLNLAER